MADKRIQDLTPASSVQTSDRFVLEQSGQAKSLTGQILLNDLAVYLDGHGGISDISYTPPTGSSLTGTLTVTLADETVETFSVTNGRGIASFAKTGTSGLEDTYTITYNDGSTPTTFTVTNGREITSVEKVDTTGLVDTYEISYNDGSEPTEFSITNGRSIESVGYVESIGLDDYYAITYNDDSEPTTFIVHNGEKGDTGDNWYVHIKWAAVMPTQDSDMVNYPSDFIGIYAGVGATAPTDYTAYDWYEYKGEKGDTGTGISSVAWQSTSGLVDTYRVQFDDGNSTTFNVTNGSQIDSITKTSTSGLVDTYTVRLTNGNQTFFQVNNGKSIVSITWTNTTSPTGVPHVPGATDTYTISYNDGDSTSFQIYNGLDGEGASITVDGIPSVNGNVPLLVIDTEHGAPTPQTAGSTKSRYFDALNSVLYICLGYDETVGYIWRGAGVTVDSALSASSTNPVQNRVITNKIGTAALDTTAQDLSGAVNEILDDIAGFADNLSDEYDPTATYEVNDLCIYNNTLYRCNTAISTPEAWNSIHWTQTSVADDKVSKSGDTMTGNLTITDNRYLIMQENATAIGDSANSNYNECAFRDKNNANYAMFSGRFNTDGTVGLRLCGTRKINNADKQNVLGLYVDSNGDPSVVISGGAGPAWRTALNAVNKAGDTMTGQLITANSVENPIKIRNTDITVGTAPSANEFQSIIFTDTSSHIIGRVRSGYLTDKRSAVSLIADNGSGVTNSMSLYVAEDGTKSVFLDSAQSWRSQLGLGTSGAFPVTVAQGGTGATANPTGIINLAGKPWKISSTVVSGTSRVLSFSGSSTLRYVVYAFGNNASSNCGEYMIFVANGASSTPLVKTIAAASALTFTAATGKVTVSSTSGTYTQLYIECMDATSYSNITVP